MFEIWVLGVGLVEGLAVLFLSIAVFRATRAHQESERNDRRIQRNIMLWDRQDLKPLPIIDSPFIVQRKGDMYQLDVSKFLDCFKFGGEYDYVAINNIVVDRNAWIREFDVIVICINAMFERELKTFRRSWLVVSESWGPGPAAGPALRGMAAKWERTP